jgi:DNA invertase Pin-like site-specific DNA recombinase
LPRAAIYTRVSTDGQAREGLSLDAQERSARERAATDGAEVVRSFQDAGISGSRTDRPAYLDLLAAAAAGELDVVYTWKLDRLGRDAEELLRARRMLGAAGVRIVSVTEGEDESTLVFGVRALVAQEEREKISERTRAGIREAARRGYYCAGAPPLGYRSVGRGRERYFLLDPEEAQIVRRVFNEYVSGVGVNRIVQRLNADGVRTRRGARFSARTILAVLVCRTYLGEVCLRGETLATGAHERIIDPDMFATAERLRAAKRSRPIGARGRPPKRHLLAGLLVCPNGHRMLAKRWAHSEYYVCCRRHSYGDCNTPNVSRRRVDETLLWHYLHRHYDEEADRARLWAAVAEKSAEARALAREADREEHAAAAALFRIRQDYLDGAISATDWNELRTELEESQHASRNRAGQLQARAAEIEAEAEHVDIEAQLVARLAGILRAAAGKTDSPEGVASMRAALQATFERIVYEPGFPSWNEVPDDSPVVCGATQLVPVVREDLMATHVSDGFVGAPSPPGRRGRRGRRSRTPARLAGDVPRPRPCADRGRRARA